MLWLVALGSALACAICAPADGQNTLMSRLFAADTVVLATLDLGTGIYRPGEVLKGRLPVEPIRVDQWFPGFAPPKSGSSALLLYSAAAREWRGTGTLPAARANWVRSLVALQPVTVLTKPDWAARLAFFAADLESAEALVAQTAYEEIALAPYGAMRALQGQVQLQPLRAWLANAALAQRKPLYTLLLGATGDDTDAQRLITGMPAAADAASVSALSAALAAVLEIRGSAGAHWLEQAYLARDGRTGFEVQAAVLALGVHGNDGGRISRERTVAAYQTLALRNPAMAGYAASDLAAWGHWEFGTRFVEILRSGVPMEFSARYPMVFFLLRSPRAQDRAAVQALRAARLL